MTLINAGGTNVVDILTADAMDPSGSLGDGHISGP